MNTNIIPRMKEIKETEGTLPLSDFSLTDMLLQYVPVATQVFADFGLTLSGDRKISFEIDPLLDKEEYRIAAKEDAVKIACSDPAGAYGALVSIAQLASLNGGKLSAFEAHDKPDLSVRAFSDDISRGQISTLENFKDIVRRCSYFKYNLYMPYIEDTLEIPGMPDFGKYSDPVPVKEWQELCAYARSYGVSVRPIVNLLGHWNKNSLLHDFRKYMLTEKREDGTERVTDVLDPRKPIVKKLIQKILDAVVEAFGTGVVHVGGDEPEELKKVLGLEEMSRLYCEHFNWICDELQKRGCSMAMYSDVFTPIWGDYHIPFENIEKMRKGITYVYWNYGTGENFPGVAQLTGSGNHTWISPASRSYGRLFPQLEATYLNCRNLARQADPACSGFVLSSWNDGGDLLREENWISIAIGSEFAWNNTSKRTMKDLTGSFLSLFYGFDDPKTDLFLSFYTYDNAFKTEDPEQKYEISVLLLRELFKDGRLPVSDQFGMQKICSKLYPELSEKLEELEELKPVRNKIALDCFKFDATRLVWVLMKEFVVPVKDFADREEARAVVDDLILLAEEFERFKKDNKRLWFKTNRQSEWNLLESRYIDTENSLYSFIRSCKYGRHM